VLRNPLTPPVMADQFSSSVSENTNPTAVCAECGNTFSEGDLIRHGNVFICANCKPVFMQKLAEGARIDPSTLSYAGVILRFGAVFLDGIILQIVHFLCALMFGLTAIEAISGQKTNPGSTPTIVLPLMFLSYVIAVGYETFMIGKYGATLGKMACKIKVVTADGGPVSYPRALGRYFAKILSGLILGIGYLMAFFDDEKRALHDRICNTRVISTNP